MARIAVALDFDGVLADSYTCMWSIYLDIARMLRVEEPEMFAGTLLLVEDIANYAGVYRISDFWRPVFRGLGKESALTDALEFYWRERARRTRLLYDVSQLVGDLRNLGADVFIVSGCDETAEGKIGRIRETGILDLFDDVIIYGCNPKVPELDKALEMLLNEYDLVVYVDDKPQNINKIGLNNSRLVVVRHVYRPPLPLALSWTMDLRRKNILETHNIYELPKILGNLLGKTPQ